MKLYHKAELVRSATKYVGSAFWEEVLTKYAKDLGCEEGNDYYNCLFYLSSLKDSDYCGEGIDPRANYYIYKRDSRQLFWFYLSSDAVAWVNVENGYDPSYYPRDGSEKGYSWTRYFDEYRGYYKNGYYWLHAEDIDKLDSVLDQKPLVHCIDNGMTFPDRATCAGWLYNSGRAVSLDNAKKTLDKHLSGKTATCYKLRFEEK